MDGRKVPVKIDGQVAGEATVHADEKGVYVTCVTDSCQELLGALAERSPAFSFAFLEEPEPDLHDPLAGCPPRLVRKYAG